MIRFAFDLLQKFEAVPHDWRSLPNPSDTQKRYNKCLTNQGGLLSYQGG